MLRKYDIDEYLLRQKNRRIYVKALKEGKILKGKACYVCGSQDRAQGHHPNMVNKPLFIISLCHNHHLVVHNRDPLRTLKRQILSDERKELIKSIRDTEQSP